jgi:protoporphyrinogen oxidase
MKKILIIGSGISGLACAFYLKKNGYEPTIYESSSTYGGKIKSPKINGYICDEGFQVLLNNYSEIKKMDCYDGINIRYFNSGANIYYKNKKLRFYNPLFHPIKFICSDFSSIFRIKDIFNIAKLSLSSRISNSTTNNYLNKNISIKASKLFFKPFFRGIYLNDKLEYNFIFFKKLINKFIFGRAGIPMFGMQELPKNIIKKGSLNNIVYNTTLKKIENNKAIFIDRTIKFDKIVLALPIHVIDQILNLNINFSYNKNSTFYFSSRLKILNKSILLIADKNFAINSIQCLTNISSAYSPEGKYLYSVSSNNNLLKINDAKYEFEKITGLNSSQYKLIKSYHLSKALPKEIFKIKNENENIFYCGDWSEEASIDGAVKSGRKTAELMIKTLK